METDTGTDSKKEHHPVTLSFQDLKTKYKVYDVVSSIQCGGNRRDGMSAVRYIYIYVYMYDTTYKLLLLCAFRHQYIILIYMYIYICILDCGDSR